jgi:DNA-binding transcriptional LysR family regulator
MIHTFSSLAAMVELSCAGFGISPLPLPVVQQKLARSELVRLPVRSEPESLPLWLSLRGEPEAGLAQMLLQQVHAMGDVVQCRMDGLGRSTHEAVKTSFSG